MSAASAVSALTLPVSTPATSYATLNARAPGDAKARAREQAVDFEAVFLNNMFSQMFAGIDGEGPLGGGKAGVWRSFLTEEYSKSFAKAGGIGIADHVYRSLLQQQEARMPTTPPSTGLRP
jgi:peptidoglycan hydrolase FlgJ